MSTFLQLYGEGLSKELGSSDTSSLFTVARRKAAINEAAQWFNVQTEALTRTAAIAVVSGQAEYDLNTLIVDADFLSIATLGRPVLKADPGGGGQIQYYTGDSFCRRSIAELDRDEEGWRAADAGIPDAWYERTEGGQSLIGLYVPPSVPAGATWTLQVPYVVLVPAMTADGDLPFTIGAVSRRDLTPWHNALSLYAAGQLEKLRKGLERSVFLTQQAEQRVLDYLDKNRAPGGKTVSVTRSYRRDARSRGFSSTDDPRK